MPSHKSYVSNVLCTFPSLSAHRTSWDMTSQKGLEHVQTYPLVVSATSCGCHWKTFAPTDGRRIDSVCPDFSVFVFSPPFVFGFVFPIQKQPMHQQSLFLQMQLKRFFGGWLAHTTLRVRTYANLGRGHFSHPCRWICWSKGKQACTYLTSTSCLFCQTVPWPVLLPVP